MSRTRLFDDFPPVSTQDWEEQITKDLRGADYGETLLWHLPDGFTLRPYYRAEDVNPIFEAAKEDVKVEAGWKVRQDIRTPDLTKAADHARSAIEGGVEVLGFDLDIRDGRCRGVPLLNKEAIDAFDFPDTAVHLLGGLFTPSLLAAFSDSKGKRDLPLTLGYDPAGESARMGQRLDHALDLGADLVRYVADHRADARVLAADATVFHDAGATPVQETALVLASISETVVQMIDRGLDAADVLARLIVVMPVGSSYFLEIAKLRALRVVLRQLVDVYVPDGQPALPPIHGEASARNRTLYDPHENLLRSTTEAAAAVLGGCDVVAVHLFDQAAGRCDEFSYRMARNIQHILRFESGFDRVADPAAGSYYVEIATDAIGRRAWQLFQEIEAQGGLFEALDNGFIHKELETARAEQRDAFAERRAVLVGSNHYPNPDERRLKDLRRPGIDVRLGAAKSTDGFADLVTRMRKGADSALLSPALDGPRIADPLKRERIAEPIELRRLRIERQTHGVRVLVVPHGDPATRSARTNFAVNFLGCGGLMIDVGDGVGDVVAEARRLSADALAFCAPDDEYPGLLSEVKRELTALDHTPVRIIVATADVANGIDSSLFDIAIHRESNLLAVLDELTDRIGLPAETIEETRT